MTAARALHRPLAWQSQWLRLRALRVERARGALRQAEQAEAAARASVEDRQRRIAEGRSALSSLARDWSGERSAGLPRWSAAVTAWRDALAERLERDEYELIDEERGLEEAVDELQRRRAELVRAMARQEAVDELVQQSRRETGRWRERLAEREQDELQGPRKGLS